MSLTKGASFRTRVCNNPKPQYEGLRCQGNAIDLVSCVPDGKWRVVHFDEACLCTYRLLILNMHSAGMIDTALVDMIVFYCTDARCPSLHVVTDITELEF